MMYKIFLTHLRDIKVGDHDFPRWTGTTNSWKFESAVHTPHWCEVDLLGARTATKHLLHVELDVGKDCLHHVCICLCFVSVKFAGVVI